MCMYENCDCLEFMTSHRLRNGTLHSILRQSITKQLHFSYLEALSIWRKKEFWASGKCSNVVCKVSCWRKNVTFGLLAASARKLCF